MTKRLVGFLAAVTASACASVPVRSRSPREQARAEDMIARNLVNGPERFVPVDAAGRDSSLVAQGTICPRVLADPGSETRIQLVRVLPVGRGDYAVPPDSYGAKSDELLRIHCVNGTPAGLVHR
jgi:hypothetical protein